MMTDTALWADKLAIREVIERYMRYNDNGDFDAIAELFDTDATFQVFGKVIVGRDAIHAFFSRIFQTTLTPWPKEGSLFLEPRSVHISSNPIIEVDGDRATAETDFQVIGRDANGHADVTLVGRYRDRFRRASSDAPWLIACRTGVSVARPGEEGGDSEWRGAIERMSDATRSRLRRS
ncbi:hypothetical protein BRW65_01575 [Mycobacterium paraffinicum]|uniref:SnoaL-like domain-containing protein n=2 Tax=Mycobacterium paraffinicum TaxID=53378 RepID=A0A1Q4I2F1_9MYCO|nr:hypothetical protein BRW65_01575 [Mycobacterium paraffinicum]